MAPPGRIPATLVVLLAVCARLWAQPVPVGSEFQVNTYTTSRQGLPAVAADSAGNFVVVWDSDSQDGHYQGIFGQRYDSAGGPLGSEFQVNTYTTSSQGSPDVAADSAGNFVVVWESSSQDGSDGGIFAQRYDSTGTPLGSEFQVNTYTTSRQGGPAVATDSAGNFAVVWSSNTQDGNSYGIFGQRYDSGGTPLGSEFQVNTYTSNQQEAPAVATDGAGNFVVVWASRFQDGNEFGIFGQRYDSAGTAQGSEFQVNTYTTDNQRFPAVAPDSAGNFVVVWQSYTQDGSSGGIFGQRYDSGGTPQGGEFQVNTYTTDYQRIPDVAPDSAGNFVVVWGSVSKDGSGEGVFGQRYDSAGTPLGSEFQVNTYTTANQRFPAVAADSAGNFVVVWESDAQDGDDYGVFGQRFASAATTTTSSSTSTSTSSSTSTSASTSTSSSTSSSLSTASSSTTSTSSTNRTSTTATTTTAPPTTTTTTTSTTTTTIVSHFQCYKVKPPRFNAVAVSLADQFGPFTAAVVRLKSLCTPVDKNGEGIDNPADHLDGYQIKGPKIGTITNVKVVNQFGTLFVDATKRDQLLVPSAKSLIASPPLPSPAIDHYQCYKVKLSQGQPKFVPFIGIVLADQFGTTTVEVKRPKRLCNPVDKNGEGINDPVHHLFCYQVKPPTKFPGAEPVFLTDQFWSPTVAVAKPQELCVPSLKNP